MSPSQLVKLPVGALVRFQFFNTPENRFYGDLHTGEVLKVLPKGSLQVSYDNGLVATIHPKEVKRILP